jgi:hypothetical protein
LINSLCRHITDRLFFYVFNDYRLAAVNKGLFLTPIRKSYPRITRMLRLSSAQVPTDFVSCFSDYRLAAVIWAALFSTNCLTANYTNYANWVGVFSDYRLAAVIGRYLEKRKNIRKEERKFSVSAETTF